MQSHFNRALAYIYICVYIVATVVYRVSQGSWGGAVWTIASWASGPPGSFVAGTLCGVCLSLCMGGLALLLLSCCSRHVTETFMLVGYVECVLVSWVCTTLVVVRCKGRES